MQTFKEEARITPAMRYFIEKNLGNTDLAAFEAEAVTYAKLNMNMNPADNYFITKLQPAGIIGPRMQAKVLDNKALQAIKFVKPFMEEYVRGKEVQSVSEMRFC